MDGVGGQRGEGGKGGGEGASLAIVLFCVNTCLTKVRGKRARQAWGCVSPPPP